MKNVWVGALILGLVGVGGCGGTDDPPASSDGGTGDGATDSPATDSAAVDTGAADTGSSDSAASDTGGGDATGDAGACNALANVADTITTQQVAEALPTLKGGTVSEGTYVITAVTAYTGPGGATGPKTGTTMQQTMRLSAGGFEIVRIQNGGAEKRSSGTYTASGTTFTLGGTCPTASSVPVEYDATATTLRISLGSTIKEILTYTKK